MYNIVFYGDENGKSRFAEYLRELALKSGKDNRINLAKMIAYMNMLEQHGTRMGEPFTKHLDGEIWELRPLKNRILYAYVKEKTFIILHFFVKKTKKTPQKEIERAKKNLENYLKRRDA